MKSIIVLVMVKIFKKAFYKSVIQERRIRYIFVYLCKSHLGFHFDRNIITHAINF